MSQLVPILKCVTIAGCSLFVCFVVAVLYFAFWKRNPDELEGND